MTRRLRLLFAFLLIPLMGAGECGEQQLTFGGEDEDGSLLAASNGRFYFAWISSRAGTTDIYIKESLDGETWGAPWLAIRRDQSYVFTDDHLNFLTEDEPGVYRLTGGHFGDPQIWTATTADIRDWPETIAATDSPELKYAISGIQRQTNGELWVVYSGVIDGNWDIFIQHLGADSRADRAPQKLTTSDRQHIFPYFRITDDDRFIIAWIGLDAADWATILNEDVYLGPTTDIYTSTSIDGAVWSSPTLVASDSFAQRPALDTLPAVLDGPDGLYLAWLTDGLGIGAPDLCTNHVVTAAMVPIVEGEPQLAASQWRYIDQPGYSIRSMRIDDDKWMLAYVKQTKVRADGTPFDADDVNQCADGVASKKDNYYRIVPNFDFPPVF